MEFGGKSARGSVGNAFRKIKKRESEEFRKAESDWQKNWYKKNREKVLKRCYKRVKELNEFADKHCKECGKLLYFSNTSGYCKIHYPKHTSKTKRKKIKNGIQEKMTSGIYKHKSHTEKTKKKISEAVKGHIVTKKSRTKMSVSRLARKSRFGYLNSFRTRKRISDSLKGYKQSEEHKKKIKLSRKKSIWRRIINFILNILGIKCQKD